MSVALSELQSGFLKLSQEALDCAPEDFSRVITQLYDQSEYVGAQWLVTRQSIDTLNLAYKRMDITSSHKMMLQGVVGIFEKQLSKNDLSPPEASTQDSEPPSKDKGVGAVDPEGPVDSDKAPTGDEPLEVPFGGVEKRMSGFPLADSAYFKGKNAPNPEVLRTRHVFTLRRLAEELFKQKTGKSLAVQPAAEARAFVESVQHALDGDKTSLARPLVDEYFGRRAQKPVGRQVKAKAVAL